jgi:hypothetical protein
MGGVNGTKVTQPTPNRKVQFHLLAVTVRILRAFFESRRVGSRFTHFRSLDLN